ncbi:MULTISPECIES: hypothetical protein [unclassified Streptomyces]|uniref:hypothetical protein n=1 Tax=unclassified Streptomyces TaxID=2593676 RepID=UPI00117D2D5F|nr:MULTISPECIES: hypothetical protein [unclassified Streptomyces]
MPALDFPLRVTTAPAAEEGDWLSSLEVSLDPPEYPDLTVTFGFLVKPVEVLHAFAFRVEPRGGFSAAEQAKVGAGLLRDMPIARWEKAARTAAVYHVEGEVPWAWKTGDDEESISRLAVEIVSAMNPDLDPKAGKGAARSWNRLIRLAEVTLQAEMASSRGEKSPAAYVAEQRGVAAATVRGWLHQARQAGIAPGEIPLDEMQRKYPGLVKHVVTPDTEAPAEG